LLHCYGPESAQPVVLLHGGPSIYGYMWTLAKELPGYRVLDYAQRGTVENPTRGRTVDLEGHIEDLHALITQHCGTTLPMLVGHSWGADLGLL
jgi:pimeloyl-ACP methyl ester carboxylesterase